MTFPGIFETWNEGRDNPDHKASAHELVDIFAGYLVVQRLDHLTTMYKIRYHISITFSKSSTIDFMFS